MNFPAPPTLAAIAFMAVPWAAQAADAGPRTVQDGPAKVTIALAPGGVREAVKTLLLKPYANASRTELGDASWNGSPDALKILAAAHGADIAVLDGASLTGLCRAQALEKLDWTRLGRDNYRLPAANECGAGAYLAATVLAWDKAKLTAAPAWPDFWDVAKHPGRRGLHRGARGNLEIALLADGAAAADISRVLRTKEGVDRAFRKLDQLKPYIEWWDQPSQPAKLLGSGRVLLTSAPAEQLKPAGAARKIPFGVQWAGNLVEIEYFALIRGTPNLTAAMTVLQIAADPARQAEFAHATGLGPAITSAVPILPAENSAASPSLSAHLQAGVVLDDAFWADNGAKLEAQFAAWLAK